MCRCRNALLMIKIHGKLFSLRATMKYICDDVNSVTWLFQITIFFVRTIFEDNFHCKK
jgi:hypothetical protein